MLASEIERVEPQIFYASSDVNLFVDIRDAANASAEKLKHAGDYDTVYPFTAGMEPVLVLLVAAWPQMWKAYESLAIFRSKNWLLMDCSTLRKPAQTDGEMLPRATQVK